MSGSKPTMALLLMLCAPVSLKAAWPEKATGIAVPVAHGIAINGPRFGDADYDPSHPAQLRVHLTGNDGWLWCRALHQSTDLDDKSSTFSAVTLELENWSGQKGSATTSIVPRFTAGVSYASVDVEMIEDDGDHVVWIAQFSGGFGVLLTQEITFDIRYRYLVPLDETMMLDEHPLSVEFDRHNFIVGLRARF